MRMSEHFGETLRKPLAEADSPGYGLLSRAGYVRPLAPGLFSYLPPGLRSLREGGAVLKRRESPDKSIVPPPNVVEAIEDIIHA